MRTGGTLSDEERLDWLQLARTPRIGPVTFFQLLQRFGTAAQALRELPKISRRSGTLKATSRTSVEEELKETRNYGADIVCACEPGFPKLLAELSPPPPVLTILGKVELTQRRSVAIVGARQASAAGRKIARDIASELSRAGFTIVSGLARGIDGEAHAASLSGGTIAVLGGGIDHIYPQQHDRLYAAIAADGAIISESPFGYRATARDFPRRNRIITGCSEGVVIVEAAERSGSLISARTALEQDRDVMAVPGSPLDPRAAGNNRLLREGAILVRHAEDVTEALTRSTPRSVKSPERFQFEQRADDGADIPENQFAAVLAVLGPNPMPIDEIARAAGVGSDRCAAILVELELEGKALTLAGGLACLAY